MSKNAISSGLLTGRKSQRVFLALRGELEAGRFSVGQQFHTINEVCETFEVSASTAVKCLDRLVQDGLLICKQGSGTFVNHVPQSGSSGLLQPAAAQIPGCLDYVMPEDIASRAGIEYFGELLATVQKGGDHEDLSLRINLLPSRLRSAEQVEDWLASRVRNGAQAFVFRWMPQVAQEVVLARGWPTCIHGHPERGIELPYVDLDQRQLGKLMAEFLIQRDCRRVALLMRREWAAGDNMLVTSLIEGLGSRLAGIETCLPSDKCVDAAARQLLDRRPEIDGLIVRNHLGKWLPEQLYQLHAEGKSLAVISDLARHPLAAHVAPDCSAIAGAISATLAQLMAGKRPNPFALEFEPRIIPPESAQRPAKRSKSKV